MLNEQTVLSVVKNVAPDVNAYFFHFTLFVEDATDTDANTIYQALSSGEFGGVEKHSYGFEYAYDFV
jgi:hypothetical protein